MLGNIKDKALEGKQVTTDAAGSAWEKTVESKDQAGTKVSETNTVVVDKASQIAQSTQETAIAGKDVAVDRASQIAQTTQETAVAGKDNTAGVLQSTGETIMNAVQGATETVKNTLGMGAPVKEPTTGEKITNAAKGTGETVVNAAQDATETVKNSLGMGDGTVTVTPLNSAPTITPIQKT